jgi:hypothetical protein
VVYCCVFFGSVGVKIPGGDIGGLEARVAHGRKAVPLQGKGP